MAQQEVSLVAKFVLKLQDAFQQSNELKQKLGKDFEEIQNKANVKPNIDSTAINTVKSRIDELKGKLTDLKNTQFSVGDLGVITATQNAIHSVQSEISSLSGTLHTLEADKKTILANDGSPDWAKKVGEDAKHSASEAHEAKGAFEEFRHVALGVFGGNALMAGTTQFGEALHHIFDAGKEAIQTMDKLKVAFNGDSEAAEKASKTADRLSSEYAILPAHLKDISANAAIMGATNEKTNASITELAAGLEKLKIPGLESTQILKGFMKGADDPEGKEGLGRLNQLLGPLAVQLVGITDPAAKAQKAMELLGPKFAILKEQAQGPGEAATQVEIAVKKFEESVGKVLYSVVATYILPPLKFIVGGLTEVADFMDEMPGPVKTVVTVLGGLGAAIFLLVGATTAWNVVSNLALISKTKEIVTEGLLSVAKLFGVTVTEGATIATIAQTIATAGLSGAMAVLTSPITIVIAILAGLVLILKYAYDHSEAFRNVVDKIGTFFKNVFIGIIQWIVKEWNLFIEAIKLTIAVFQFLYDHLGPIKTAIEGLIATVKEVVNWFGNLFSSTEKLTEAQKKHKEETNKDTEALAKHREELEAQVKAYENAAKAAKKYMEDISKGSKQDYDNAKDIINLELKRLQDAHILKVGQTAKQTLSILEGLNKDALDSTLKQSVESVISYVKFGKSKLKDIKNQDTTSTLAGALIGDEEAPVKTAGAVETILQQINRFIKEKKALMKTGDITDLEAIAAFDKKRTELETIRQKTESELKAKYSEDKDKDKLGKALGKLDEQQTEAEAALLLASENLQKLRRELLQRAHLTEESDLQGHLDSIKKKYEEMNLAVQKLTSLKMISDEDAAKANMLHEQARALEEYNAIKKAGEERFKLKEETIKKDLEATQKGAVAMGGIAQYAVELSALREYQSKKEAAIKERVLFESEQARAIIKDSTALQVALTKITRSGEEDRRTLLTETVKETLAIEINAIEAKRKVALQELDIELAKRHASKNTSEYKIAQLELEHSFQLETLRKKYSNEQEYQQQVLLLTQDYSEKRSQLEAQAFTVEGMAYRDATAGIQGLFETMTSNIESMLGEMFGYEKSQMEQMSETDKRLAQLDLEDKKSKLNAEVEQNKMSAQRASLEKTKAQEDFDKKMGKSRKEELSVVQQFEKTLTNTVVSELAKRMEQKASDAIFDLMFDQAAAEGNFIASVFKTMPWFVAVPIIAAGLAGVAALFGSITKPKGAAQGLKHDPLRDGKSGQMIAIGETGKTEFASPEETAMDYFSKELGPKIYDTAIRNSLAMHSTGNIVPRIAPTLAPNYNNQNNNIVSEHLDRLNTVLNKLTETGIAVDVTGKIDAKLTPRETANAARKREKEINRRAGTVGGGMR